MIKGKLASNLEAQMFRSWPYAKYTTKSQSTKQSENSNQPRKWKWIFTWSLDAENFLSIKTLGKNCEENDHGFEYMKT